MRVLQSFLMILLVLTSAVATSAGGDADTPATPNPPANPEEMTCEDWVAQQSAPDGYVGRPDLWAACQHERLVLTLANDPPERLAAFLHLEENLRQMCDALVELGDLRTGGGTWVLHEQPRTRGEISRDLYAINRLYTDGHAADSADSVRAELDYLRHRVVDRVRLPSPEDLRAAIEIYGDSTSAAGAWQRYSESYMSVAYGVTSPNLRLLQGHDRAALEVLRVADRMIRLYLGDD